MAHLVRSGRFAVLTRVAATCVLVLTGLVVAPPPASASGDCPPGSVPRSVPGAGVICIRVTYPGDPGDPAPQPTPDPGGGGCQRDDGTPVDCMSPWGVWVDAHQCLAHPVDVPPDDPAWEGHADGSVWMCALNYHR